MVFDQGACLCFVELREEFIPDITCPDGTIENPLYRRRKDEYCISLDEYVHIYTFAHDGSCNPIDDGGEDMMDDGSDDDMTMME